MHGRLSRVPVSVTLPWSTDVGRMNTAVKNEEKKKMNVNKQTKATAKLSKLHTSFFITGIGGCLGAQVFSFQGSGECTTLMVLLGKGSYG